MLSVQDSKRCLKAPTLTNLLQFLRTSCTHRKNISSRKQGFGRLEALTKIISNDLKGELESRTEPLYLFGSCHVIWPKNIAINYKPSSFNFLHPSMDADSLIGDFPYFCIIVRPKCVDGALQPPSGCCQAGRFLLQASCLRSLAQHNLGRAKFWCTAWDKKLSLFKFCSSNGKFWFDCILAIINPRIVLTQTCIQEEDQSFGIIWMYGDHGVTWCNMT
jgi:hypothetical protein